MIPSKNFGYSSEYGRKRFDGDLIDEYLDVDGGIGTYKRSANGYRWTKK